MILQKETTKKKILKDERRANGDNRKEKMLMVGRTMTGESFLLI